MRYWMPLVGLWFAVGSGFAQDNKPDGAGSERGLYVPVSHPLTSDGLTRITNLVDAEIGKGRDRPAWVVFDFTPDGKDAHNPNHALPAQLAEYILNLNDVKTVAFVTRKAFGHTPLPALACLDLVMGKDASIGEVIGPTDKELTGLGRASYEQLVKRHPTRMAAIRKMFDPRVRLGRADKGNGSVLVDMNNKAEMEGTRNAKEVPGIPSDSTALYKTAQATDLGLCRGVRDTVPELADLLGIVPGSLRADPLNGRPPEAFRYTLAGAIDHGVKESVVRTLRGVLDRKGNLVFLQLECAAGDLDAARELAEELVKFQKPDSGDGIKIVAFVPNSAPDTAAVIALGCTEIVMSRRTDAKTGDADPPQADFGDFSNALGAAPQSAEALRTSLRELATKQGYPPLLAEGMVRKDLGIVQARSSVDRQKTRLMTPEEFDAAPAEWKAIPPKVVKKKGEWLKLTADAAEQLGLAKTTNTRDLAELAAKYGAEPGRVKDATPAWLDRFAAFLRDPIVTVLLVVVGFVGLILELKVPGATIPGIIAALSFICVFWAHTQFSGQIAVLAGLLFLLGLILVLLEVFVIPGIGAALIFGILLMVGALALITVDQIPDTGAQWITLGSRMARFLFALIAGFFLALIVARYVPSLPIANKMFLPPVDTGADADAVVLPGAAKAAALLGAIGTTTTVLRPAGTVLFGDDLVDVVTDGGYVASGTKVQVIEVEGTRIVVKAV